MIRRLVESRNDKIAINKWLALFTFIILLVGTIFSVTNYSVSATNELAYQSERIQECKDNIAILAESVTDNQIRLTAMETHYVNIKSQLNRIEEKLE